jgi:hypothetical protein
MVLGSEGRGCSGGRSRGRGRGRNRSCSLGLFESNLLVLVVGDGSLDGVLKDGKGVSKGIRGEGGGEGRG